MRSEAVGLVAGPELLQKIIVERLLFSCAMYKLMIIEV